MSGVRKLEPSDLAAVLALNNAHQTEVGPLDPQRLERLTAIAPLAIALGPAGDPDAYLLAYDEHTPPQGPNHAWFIARHRSFLYIDRVCVHARARRRGLARALYVETFAAAARAKKPVVCCEVNFVPPNPISDAFHEALGFHEVGRAVLHDRGKSVRYLERAAAP